MAKRQDLEESYLRLLKLPEIYQGDLEASVPIILRHCARSLGVDRASLWIVSDQRNALDCYSLYRSSSDDYETGAVLYATDYPRYFKALLDARLVDADDAANDPRTAELTTSYLKPLDVRSLLDATIRNPRSQATMMGLLCTESVGERRAWTREERAFVGSVGDLLAQRLVSDQLTQSEAKYRALFDSSVQAILLFNGAVFADVNQAACELFGARPDQLTGRSPVDLSPTLQPDGQPSADAAIGFVTQCLAGTPQLFEWRHRRIDGSLVDVEVALNPISISGKDTLFAIIRDITAQKEAERLAVVAQQRLEHRAAHDSLTGLLNREQLHSHVNRLIAEVTDPTHEVALLLFDLNRFKEINDTLGHSTGDRVLVQIAEILDNRVRAIGGTLFRLGGDEFVAVFTTTSCSESFDDLVSILNNCLDTSVVVEEISFEIGASIGASTFPQHGDDSHELLRCADVAMYHGKNNDDASPWYERTNDINDKRRLAMAAELRSGIREGQLVLHYQPRIQIASGTPTGCEALVRWQHPEMGLLAPARFLPLAETTDLIHPLTVAVVHSAFAQIKRLRSAGYHIPVAVNLSARNLPDAQLFDLIEDLLVADSLDPALFEVEITESALIKNPQRALQNLQRLETLGVSIAIDDFGTGYSSLSLLKALPLDTLKIDRSFVNDLCKGGSDEVIVSSTISLAHNFSATAVAEGVENQQTLDALAALDCDQAQGFFIARPMPQERFEQWLETSPAKKQASASN